MSASNELASGMSRRRLLLGATTAWLCAPALVRATSLMPLRGIVLPTERMHHGSVLRMWVYGYLPSIRRYQNAGLSLREIAPLLGGSMNGKPMDAAHVRWIIMTDEAIRRQDAIIRAERLMRA